MPRRPRHMPGGLVYHVLNRASGRARIFEDPEDYLAFEAVLWEAKRFLPMRILSYCVMPNHWHFVVWPRNDKEATSFFRWLTSTHAQRWLVCHATIGTGPLYQGRFRSFPVSTDQHFYAVCRYVERNALRAGLVKRAEDWRWSSLWRRHNGDRHSASILDAWPLPEPEDWIEHVNQPQTDAELEAIRNSVVKGSPFGAAEWRERTAKELSLTSTLRPRGRPRAEKPPVPFSRSSRSTA